MLRTVNIKKFYIEFLIPLVVISFIVTKWMVIFGWFGYVKDENNKFLKQMKKIFLWWMGLVILGLGIWYWWGNAVEPSGNCPVPFSMSDDLYEKSDRWGWKKYVWAERGVSFDVPNDWYVDDTMFSDNLMLYSQTSFNYYYQECNSDKTLRLTQPFHDMYISYDIDLKHYLERIDLYKGQNSLVDFLNNDNRYNKYVKTEVDGNLAYDVDEVGGLPTIYVERQDGLWQFGYDGWNNDVEGIMKSVDFAE